MKHCTARRNGASPIGILLTTLVGACLGNDSIGSPVLWLRADSGVTVDDSSCLTAWVNLGTHPHVDTIAESQSPPVLIDSVAGGKPALRFGGEHYVDRGKKRCGMGRERLACPR